MEWNKGKAKMYRYIIKSWTEGKKTDTNIIGIRTNDIPNAVTTEPTTTPTKTATKPTT
jgi:hypothetical protein